MSDEEKRKQAGLTAVRMLAASPKTRQEMARKLSDKGYSQSIVQETLDLLEKQQVLNDRAYARNLLNRFRLSQPSGRRKIAFELKRHGIAKEICEEVLSEVNPEEENERAREMALAKWNASTRLSLEKRKKKVFDFLVRRGFDFQIAKDLMNEFSNDSDEAV